MKIPMPLFGLILQALCHVAPAEEMLQERAEWREVFEAFDADGTIVVADERKPGGEAGVFDQKRAMRRFSPASTFKIPHALFALESGVVRDEFQTFKWDGAARKIEAWNQDQTLRSSMRNSVVWVYEMFAREIGLEAEGRYLKQIDYGNADTSGTEPFWIEGNLKVSAMEQIAFLRRLFRNELPFRLEHQRLVKDILVVEAGRDWILRAKTGWSGTVGWWVGWVEWPTGPVFFALNIDTPNRLDDLPKREAITRRILQSLKALPSD